MKKNLDNHYEIESFYQYCTKVEIKKGEYIYSPYSSSRQSCAFFLDSGLCALSADTAEGDEKIYLYFKPKRMIGFSQLMLSVKDKQPQSNIFSITAKTDCILYKMTSKVFYKLLDTNSVFTHFMMDVLSENYVEALLRYHQAQDEPVTTRLFRLLVDQCITENNRLILPSYFSYAELSRYLGTHSVTVARIMAKLKQLGFIEKHGHSLVITNYDCIVSLIEKKDTFIY